MSNKNNIVAINALIKDKSWEKFLIIKRSENEIAYPGKWAFPWWKMEPNETIMDALKREVLEEVWLEIEDTKKFLKDFNFVRKDWYNVIGLCFAVVAKTYSVKLLSEFSDYKWVAKEEFKNYDYIAWMEEEVELAF